MRLPVRLALSVVALLCIVESAKVAQAGVVILDATRFVTVFPEASQSGITPAQGPRVQQDGAGVFGEETVQQQFTGPGGTSASGRASQVSIIDETGFDFHGAVEANSTDPFILSRSFLGFAFDITTPINYLFRVDYDAVPDVDSQNADNQLDVLELLFTRETNGGGSSIIYAEDRTFFELFPKNVPGSSGTLEPGRYRVAVTFDAPVRGVENVDMSYDIGLTLGGNMPPPQPIPLPPAAWAGLSTLGLAGAIRGLRRLSRGR